MSARVDVLFPADSQEGTESIIAKWLKQPGQTVTLHEPLVEINTDKVTVEVAATSSGVLKEIILNEGAPIKPGDVLGWIEEGAGAAKATAAPQTEASGAKALANTQELSPAVKKLIKDNNIDVSKLRGSGKDGRITHQDVTDYLSGSEKSQNTGKKIPLSPMRKSIAQHMVQSLLHTAPHVTSVFEADLTAVMNHRDKNKSDCEAKGFRLTYTAYFVKACALAAKAVPEVNSRYHEDGIELISDINVGVATALENVGNGDSGLIVPVIHQAQNLSLFDIAQKLDELTKAAKANSLQPAQVQDGTITISNHGVSGSLVATPIIINQPQSAILGIGKLEKRVVVVEESGKDQMQIRPMLYVTLTIDHRVLDGFKANAFLTAFVEAINSCSFV